MVLVSIIITTIIIVNLIIIMIIIIMISIIIIGIYIVDNIVLFIQKASIRLGRWSPSSQTSTAEIASAASSAALLLFVKRTSRQRVHGKRRWRLSEV